MIDPWTTSMRMQQAVMAGCLCGAQMFARTYMQLVDQNMRLLQVPTRRAEDMFLRPQVMPGGPDLTDHYGKRNHDVDVEKAV